MCSRLRLSEHPSGILPGPPYVYGPTGPFFVEVELGVGAGTAVRWSDLMGGAGVRNAAAGRCPARRATVASMGSSLVAGLGYAMAYIWLLESRSGTLLQGGAPQGAPLCRVRGPLWSRASGRGAQSASLLRPKQNGSYPGGDTSRCSIRDARRELVTLRLRRGSQLRCREGVWSGFARRGRRQGRGARGRRCA